MEQELAYSFHLDKVVDNYVNGTKESNTKNYSWYYFLSSPIFPQYL